MSIEAEINRLGGIQPPEDQFLPLTADDLAAVQTALAHPLPPDYAHLLRQYGGFSFINSVAFRPLSEQPAYQHPADLGIPNGDRFRGSQVAEVYGKRADEFTLLDKLTTYRARMPAGFLPVADDGLGNQLCLCLRPDTYGFVYWWDHELEWDAEDYAEETGRPMPAAAQYQNLYLVARSLPAFFRILTVSALA